MNIALGWMALRRHPFSILCTAVLAALSASLVGVPVPAALLVWAAASLLGITAWRALEEITLGWLGCRRPNRLEQARFGQALALCEVDVLVRDAAEPWIGRGLRHLVVTSALLDLLEDPAILRGLLTQAAGQLRSASLAAELVVWLGNLPLLGAWVVARGLVALGRLLAIAVGSSLVVPILLWPAGFSRWAGRLFGSAIVGLFGSALLSSGLAAPGLGLLLAWALIPGLQMLLAWESRRVELAADQATIAAGLGWQLLRALEILALAESLPLPTGVLGWLARRGSPLASRADSVWRALSKT